MIARLAVKACSGVPVGGFAYLNVSIGGLKMAVGTVTGIPGLPIVTYLSSVRMPRVSSCATVFSLFALIYAISIGLQVAFVGIARETLMHAFGLITFAFIGLFLGQRFSSRIGDRTLHLAVLGLPFVAGLYTFMTGFR